MIEIKPNLEKEMQGSAYRIENTGQGADFIITHAPGQSGNGGFITLILLGTVLALAGLFNQSLMLFIVAALCFALTYVIHLGNKRSPLGGNFTISSHEIIVGERRIPLNRIDGLYIRNAISEEKQSIDPAYLALGSAMAMRSDYATSSIGAMHVARAAVAAKRKRKAAATSWLVAVESGGRATTLASGLDDVTARGLVADVQRQVATR